MLLRIVRLVLVCSVLLAIVTSWPAEAGTMNLSWDAVPGATGYRVYHGTQPGVYDHVTDVGNATSTSVTGLADCTEYFVAVKAYNVYGESAGFSNEVVGWARPEVDALTPGLVDQGGQYTLTISGANFGSGAALDFQVEGSPTDVEGNPLIRLDDLTVISCNQMQGLLTVEPTARGLRAMEVGPLSTTVEVVNTDGVFGSSSPGLSVGFALGRTDINRDDSSTRDRVDGKDLISLAYSHGTNEGEPRFNPDADLDGDGRVDGNDLAFLAVRFGQCWTGSAWSDAACL